MLTLLKIREESGKNCGLLQDNRNKAWDKLEDNFVTKTTFLVIFRLEMKYSWMVGWGVEFVGGWEEGN